MSLRRPMATVQRQHTFISNASSLPEQVLVVSFCASPYVFLFHLCPPSYTPFCLSTSTFLAFCAFKGLHTTRESLPVPRPYLPPPLSPPLPTCNRLKVIQNIFYHGIQQ